MKFRIVLGAVAAAFLLGVGAYAATRLDTASLAKLVEPRPYSRQAFDDWLADDPRNAADFAEFSAFLGARGVDTVVPSWQLTRTDSQRSSRCKRPQFLVPPRDQWLRIVPVLRLVRDKVVPEIGPLEAVSAYRTTVFNGCIGGASRSQHIGFAAVDFIAPGQPDNRALFRDLCAIQRRLGPESRFGLGAYFDPAKPQRNTRGRFHVDVSGFRNWGPSYHSESSGCNVL